MGYKKETIKGVSWVGLFRLFSRFISLLKTVILARVFSPSQFGVFGIAALVLAFLEILTEAGINIFIVQSKEKIEKYLDTTWVISIVRGLIIGIIIFLLAPFISSFFNSKESLSIISFIAIVPIIRGFVNPAKNLLQKNLSFNKEFYLQGTLLIIDSLFAIISSVILQNIVGLVIGLVASAILEVILTFIFIKPRPKFMVNYQKTKIILRRGKWVTVFGIAQYISENLDNICIGKFLGTSQLGVYQAAYRISTLTVTEIGDVINRVSFPLYVKISNDKEKLKAIFLKTSIGLSLLVIPVGLFFFFFSKEVILILLGEKWLSAVPILKILSFYGILRSIIGYSSSLFLGLGMQKYVAYMTITRGIAFFITIFPLLYGYGVIGVAVSAFLSVLAEMPIAVYLVNKVFKK